MDRAQSMTGSTGGLTRPDAARGPRRILDAVVQAVLGPWPLLPIVSGVLVALVLTYQNMQLAVTSAGTTCQLWCIRPWAAIAPLSLEPGRTPPVDLAIVLLNAIICGVGVGLSLGAFRRWWSPTEGTSL